MILLNSYQKKAVSTKIYKSEDSLIYPALGLCGESGEVAEKIKKILRDQNGKINDDNKLQVKKELGDVLWYLANLANDLGVTLEDVAKTNLKKLKVRQKNKTLHGSGDER